MGEYLVISGGTILLQDSNYAHARQVFDDESEHAGDVLLAEVIEYG